jgi:hypothetical protein
MTLDSPPKSYTSNHSTRTLVTNNTTFLVSDSPSKSYTSIINTKYNIDPQSQILSPDSPSKSYTLRITLSMLQSKTTNFNTQILPQSPILSLLTK